MDKEYNLHGLRVILFTSKCPDGLTSPDSLAIPLGLHTIKTYLTSYGAECDVCDFDLQDEQPFVDRIGEGYYDVIGLSPTHWNMPTDLEFLFKIKRLATESGSNSLFIAGGHTATLAYQDWLPCGIDVIFLGHAEHTLLEYLNRFVLNNKELSTSLCNELDGVAYVNDDADVVVQHLKTQDSDEFVHSNFDIAKQMDAPYSEYWSKIRSRTTALQGANDRSYVVENARLYTSNRCIAKCGFCSSVGFLPVAHDKKWKFGMLSADQILDLIKHNVAIYGARGFSLNDDDFLVGNNVGIKRAMRLCELITDAKDKGEIPKEVKFSCQTRVGNFLTRQSHKGKADKKPQMVVNNELMAAMRRAGFHNVSLGVESFSERLMKVPSINKIGITKAICETVLDAFFDHELFPTINLILLIPESTPSDLCETLYTAVDYLDKPMQISTSKSMRMFPGAPIWGSAQYPSIDVIKTNELTGESISIPVYCVPHDKKLQGLIECLDDHAAEELQMFHKKYHLDQYFFPPRLVISLCNFLAIAKYLEEQQLIDKIEAKLEMFAVANGLSSDVPTSHLGRYMSEARSGLTAAD